MRSHRVFSLFFAAILAESALGQDPVATQIGDALFDYLGSSVASVGDIDLDGIPDYAAGADGDDNNGNGSGSVRVFSGCDHSVIWNFNGDAAGDEFGAAVAPAGDLNQDGFPDVLVGAPGGNGGTGFVRVVSGRNSLALVTLFGTPDSEFGAVVVLGGDVDNDGTRDYLIGAPNAEANGVNAGSVFVYSGATATLLHTISGVEPTEEFGAALADAGDLNADGHDDVLIGAPFSDAQASNGGRALVVSGIDGQTVLAEVTGDVNSDFLGTAVVSVGNIDFDSVPDFLVGIPGGDPNGTSSGLVRLISGASSTLITSFAGVTALGLQGQSLAAADFNQDGVLDFLVGATGDAADQGRGTVRVYSGKSLNLMYTLEGLATSDTFGTNIATMPDISGDGFPEILAADPLDDSGGGDSGMIRLYTGNDLFVNSSPRTADTGDTWTVSIGDGSFAEPFALFLTEANGSPTFGLLFVGLFSITDQFLGSLDVGPGLSGNTATFRAYKLLDNKLVDSNDESVVFP